MRANDTWLETPEVTGLPLYPSLFITDYFCGRVQTRIVHSTHTLHTVLLPLYQSPQK